MNHQNYQNKAESLFERAMDNIYHHIDSISDDIEALGAMIENGNWEQQDYENADNLITNILINLEKVR